MKNYCFCKQWMYNRLLFSYGLQHSFEKKTFRHGTLTTYNESSSQSTFLRCWISGLFAAAWEQNTHGCVKFHTWRFFLYPYCRLILPVQTCQARDFFVGIHGSTDKL
jgi:hypothetical protein